MCQRLQLEILLYEWCLTEIQVVCKGLRQLLGASFPHYHVPSSCSVMEDERLQMKSGERWGNQEELLEKEFLSWAWLCKMLGADDMSLFLSCNASPVYQEKSFWMCDPCYHYYLS